MERSRKGTRLNDAHYFRQPLPHLRKKMTKLRVMPIMSDNIIVDNVIKNPIWMRYQSNSLSRDQPSTEITITSYKNPNKNNLSIEHYDKKCREIAIETLPEIELSIQTLPIVDLTSKMQNTISQQTAAMVTNEFKNNSVHKPKKMQVVRRHKIVKQPKKTYLYENNVNTKEEKSISWWKIIVNFLTTFMGKRESNIERRSQKQNAMKMNSRAQIKATPKNLDIHQYYLSVINEKSSRQNKLSGDMERQFRELKSDKYRYQFEQNIRTRRTSSTLY